MYCKILEKLYYDIRNKKGNNHKWKCRGDMILMIIYTVISLWNAMKVWIPSCFAEQFGITGSVPTPAVLAINIIVLVRINISISIKYQDNVKAEMEKLIQAGDVASEIIINTWLTRKKILQIGYVIDIVIAILFLFYREAIESALSIIVIVAIIETFINNFVENLQIRFEAIPKVYRRCG